VPGQVLAYGLRGPWDEQTMSESNEYPGMAGYPVVNRITVQWGDLDAYGHVNNVVYLKWFEATRADYARRVGVEVLDRNQGVGAILTSIHCDYRRQLAYPGEVLSGVRITRISIGSVTLEFLIADATTGVPIAQGGCDVVLYSYADGKPVPVPDDIRRNVEKLEGREFPL
jgi:acyl-CoA thioester hydrolase